MHRWVERGTPSLPLACKLISSAPMLAFASLVLFFVGGACRRNNDRACVNGGKVGTPIGCVVAAGGPAAAAAAAGCVVAGGAAAAAAGGAAVILNAKAAGAGAAV